MIRAVLNTAKAAAAGVVLAKTAEVVTRVVRDPKGAAKTVRDGYRRRRAARVR